MAGLKEFNDLKIKLEDIIAATNNFNEDKKIGSGAFGPVYKGELSLPEGPTTVAFKCLDRRLGQGNIEFWKEIVMLSKCKHENLVSLMRFCDEGDARVLVYEYASRGSLDKYLGDVGLTWTKRVEICIGAANALQYLHDPMQTQERILHRDIKSSNILLDDNWTAKVSDFGLSKIGPANQAQTYLISNVVGTIGYCDPLYAETGLLTKESDVYSFGVVLFEVMCGRLCCEFQNDQLVGVFIRNWKKCYVEKKLEEIVFKDLKEEMDLDSLRTFSTIANQCLNRDRRHRPTMDKIVEQLHVALEHQKIKILLLDRERRERTLKMVEISKLAVTPLSYNSEKELILQLFEGILIEDGKQKYWVDKATYGNCFFVYAKGLAITWIGDDRYWRWSSMKETNEISIDVAELLRVCWLEVVGKFDMAKLTPGIKYEVVFEVMMEDYARGWEVPIDIKLVLPHGNKQEHKENMLEKPKSRWFEIPVGELMVEENKGGYVDFSLFKNGAWKNGLLVKGAAIRPKN